jgi:hypothetical protein
MKYYFGIIAVIIMLFIGVKLAFPGTSSTPTSKSATKKSGLSTKVLSDYVATNAEVSVTVEGPIVGHEIHTATRIIVSRDERRVEYIVGYENLVVKSKNFDNNQAAFDAFLHALEYQAFLKEIKPKIADDTGVCATGTKYIYELKNTNSKDTDKRLWSVTCGVGIGNAGSNGPLVRDLFQKQIPDYVVVVGLLSTK